MRIEDKQRIEDELERISAELRRSYTLPDRYVQLYAAQQALSWAIFPGGSRAPYDTIMGGQVQPIIPDTREGSTDCSAVRHPPPS